MSRNVGLSVPLLVDGPALLMMGGGMGYRDGEMKIWINERWAKIHWSVRRPKNDPCPNIGKIT